MIISSMERTQKQGAALIAVLWLIAILAIASMTALRVLSFDIDIATSKIFGSRARQMAEMGIAVGSNPQVKRSDPLLIRESEQSDEGYQVKISSEGGRFNINAILMRRDTALLSLIFEYWGLDLEESQALVDALMDWTDADDEVSLNGAEKEQYEAAGRMNQPFNRPFYHLSEMRLVRGMDLVEAVRPDWWTWFTIWSSGQLDLNDASAELISVAAQCPLEDAQDVVESISGEDGMRDTEDDVPFNNVAAALDLLRLDPNGSSEIAQRFTVNDPTTRIESIGYSGEARRKFTVILRNRTGKPALLERTEEIIP